MYLVSIIIVSTLNFVDMFFSTIYKNPPRKVTKSFKMSYFIYIQPFKMQTFFARGACEKRMAKGSLGDVGTSLVNLLSEWGGTYIIRYVFKFRFKYEYVQHTQINFSHVLIFFWRVGDRRETVPSDAQCLLLVVHSGIFPGRA